MADMAYLNILAHHLAQYMDKNYVSLIQDG